MPIFPLPKEVGVSLAQAYKKMYYEEYKVPESVSEQDEFIFNMIDEFYTVGSHTGFVMGEFVGLIEHMKEKELPADIIKEAETVFSAVNGHLSEYHDSIYGMVKDEWERLGKPLSMEEHLRRKAEADRYNNNKHDW